MYPAVATVTPFEIFRMPPLVLRHALHRLNAPLPHYYRECQILGDVYRLP